MKIRNFGSYDEYEATGECNVIDIVKHGKHISADLITECKSFKTALNRFFKAIKDIAEFEGWEEPINESCEYGAFQIVSRYSDDSVHYHHNVEELSENLWYVELTVEV